MADTSDIRNLRGELAKVLVDFQKEIDNGVKKLGSLTKSADDLGKKMGNWVEPAALLDKALAKISVEQTALQNQAQSYRSIQQRAISDAYRINDQIKLRNALSKLTSRSAEQELTLQRLTADNLEKQRRSLGLIVNEATRNARSATETAKSLGEQKENLEKIQAIYMTIMSLGEKYDKMLSDEAKAQGTTKDEINGQYDAIQKINNGLGTNLASNQEILKSVTSLRNEYSLTDSQLASIGKESANISRLTGLTVDEATKFQATLAEVGGTSVMAQEAMTAIASKAAEAAGVPMGKVMKDVANASSGVRLIFKGNTTELIKQAAEARKLGTSLDSAAKSAESLLSFESSIGAELKLSALLGKNVNFNESRRLAFAGDLIGSEKALQKEVEKVGDLDKLNYIQRKALSEVTGKDFGELQKIQTQKKNLLEAERMFPKEAAKMKKAQEELKVLQKGGLDARKQELQLLMDQKTAEAESAKLAQVKEQALLNLGKLLKPLYDAIMLVQIGFFKLINYITNIGDPIGKWTAISVTAIGLLTAAFFALKYGGKAVLDFLGDIVGKMGQSIGEGIGKGLEGIGKGITSMATALGSVKPGDIIKMAIILGVLTLAVFGLAKAFSMLGNVSGEQIMAFTKSIVILGVSLAVLGAIMLIPGIQLGVLAFAAALGIVSLSAIGFAKAIQMVTPSLSLIGVILTSLGEIVAGVIKDAFQKMYDVFVKLPEIVGGVAGPLIKLAMVAPLLVIAAAGVAALTLSIGSLGVVLALFPTSWLEGVVTQFVNLAAAAKGLNIFDAVLATFKLLPGLISGVVGPLIKLATVSPLLVGAAAAVGALTLTVGTLGVVLTLFPTSTLTEVATQFVNLAAAAKGLNIFDAVLATFKLLPGLISGVVGPLIKLATVSPLLVGAAAAVGALTLTVASLGVALTLFPTSTLTEVVIQLSKLSSVVQSFNIFDTITTVFKTLSTSISSVISSLLSIANIGFLKLSGVALGITAISSSIAELGSNLQTFPSSQLEKITAQLVALSTAADGLKDAVGALKDLSGIELPKLDMDFKGIDTFSKTNDAKEKQTSEIKAGLEIVAQRIDNLTSMMVNGGIAVNLDGQRVNAALSTTMLKSGGFGQSTTRA